MGGINNPSTVRSLNEFHVLAGYSFLYPAGPAAGDKAVTVDQLWAAPIMVSRPLTIDRIAFYVATLAAGATARVGVYAAGVNQYPGALLKDAGTVSVATTGLKEVTVTPSLKLQIGLHWLAIISDGSPVLKASSPAESPLDLHPNFANLRADWWVAQAYGALPDPFTAPAGNSEVWRLNLGVRILSLD